MEEKEDLRVRRTRKLLSDSLVSLMETTPYNKISVNDICEKAMVHRATFYNHFYDKDDLFNYILESLQNNFFENTIEKQNFSSSKDMYLSIMLSAYDYIDKNKNVIHKIQQNDNEKLLAVIIRAIKKSILYCHEKSNFNVQYRIPFDLLVDFFVGGIAMIGFNIIDGKIKYSREELMKYCETLLNDKLII